MDRDDVNRTQENWIYDRNEKSYEAGTIYLAGLLVLILKKLQDIDETLQEKKNA